MARRSKKPILALSKVPSVEELCNLLGFKNATPMESSVFTATVHAFRKSYATSDGRSGVDLVDWYNRQEELGVMAVAFVETHGYRFWSNSRRWMGEDDVTYPKDKNKICYSLKQLLWKQNKYALNNQTYGEKTYGQSKNTPEQSERLMVPLLDKKRQISHSSCDRPAPETRQVNSLPIEGPSPKRRKTEIPSHQSGKFTRPGTTNLSTAEVREEMSQERPNESNSFVPGIPPPKPNRELQLWIPSLRHTPVQGHPEHMSPSQPSTTASLQSSSEPNNGLQVQEASPSPQQPAKELAGPTCVPQPAIAPSELTPEPGIEVVSVASIMPAPSSSPQTLFWITMPDGSEGPWRNGEIQSKTISTVTEEISNIVEQRDIGALQFTLKVRSKASVMAKVMRVDCDMEDYWKSMKDNFNDFIKEAPFLDGIRLEMNIKPFYKFSNRQ